MTLKVGDRLPDAKFTVQGPDGPEKKSVADIFSGKKVVLFAVPGAFTPTCSEKHLPGFIDNASAMAAKGVSTIACTAVNDIFVLSAWGNARSADGKITMLADGNGDFATATGLVIDLSPFGLGARSQRYAAIIDDGVVTYLAVEKSPPEHDQATAEKLMKAL